MTYGRVAICGILLLCALGAAINLAGTQGHDFTDACTDCHTSSEGGEAGPALLKKMSTVARRCSECHRLNPRTSHPVGMVVQAGVPEVFPLDESGRMTCLSCHWAHPSDEEGEPEALLRTDATAMCAGCHVQAFDVAEADRHAMAFREAHTKAEAGNRTIGGIHERSLVCLSCHEDFTPTDSSSRDGKRWKSHPIGVSYPAGGGPRGDFRPRNALGTAVRLLDGKVECESCHNLYSKIEPYLVMSNRGSRLCLSCHNK